MATAQDIINAATQELGLPIPAVFSGNDDQIGYQAIGLLNSLGDELVRVHDWQFLEQVESYVGDGIATDFPLPADFARIVNQTAWDTNNRRQMIGPLNAQQWAWTQYGIVSVGVYYRYRILGNKFTVYPTPPVGEIFDLYYISKNWVEIGNTPGTYRDTVLAANDIPVFNRRMLVAGVKYKLWGAKGLDTTSLGPEFDYVLKTEMAQNQGASVINLTSQPMFHYIDGSNVPDGTWAN